MKEKSVKIYHLSHIDLDGYMCQYLSNFYFKNVNFYNSNYGREIDEKMDLIFQEIEEENGENRGSESRAIIVITDLNLNLKQCMDFEARARDAGAKIFLLDHHQSGEECAARFEWYLLDIDRCASLITYEFFAGLFGENQKLKNFVKIVNAVDLWIAKSKYFEFGKVCLGLVAGARELNRVIFARENIFYIFYLIKSAMGFAKDLDENISEKLAPHLALDNAVHFLKKDFFKGENDNTLANLIAHFVVDLLSKNRKKFLIEYQGQQGILTYNIGSTSIIGNEFLLRNPDLDFFVDLSSKKSLSFRANNKIDVSLMAKNLVGGGGHKNASGGLFLGFKDSSNYEIIKGQMLDLIRSKEN